MKNRFFFHWILPLIIAATAMFIAYWFIAHAPKAKPRPTNQRQATIVSVKKPEFGNFKTRIDTVGEVLSFNTLDLKSKVSGEVIWIAENLEPGKAVKKGDLLAQIDDTDYQLIKKQRLASLQQAQSELKLEHGRQIVAQNDLKLTNRSSKFTQEQLDLALRKPQLLQYQAGVTKAQAALDETKLAIKRTKIYAPWDAVISERKISIGTNVTAQQAIATLVADNKLKVKVSIDSDLLRFVRTRNDTSKAQIYSDNNSKPATGKVFSILPSLSAQSRMAQVLIEIDNNNDDSNSLRINDFVNTTILGTDLNDVFRVNRSYLHDGNTVWLMRNSKKGSELVIISPQIIYEDQGYVYFESGILPDDHLVTSNLSSPIDGMLITTSAAKSTKNNGIELNNSPERNNSPGSNKQANATQDQAAKQ